MLPIDPRDRQGSYLPGGSPPVPPEGAPDGQNRHRIGHAVTPAQPVRDVSPARPLRDIVPAQAMAHGGTIIRPGAVAWGGLRDARDSGYSSGESIERILASAIADPGLLPALLAELAGTRLWVPLPVRRRPFTDGTAVRLPLVGYAETDTDFVPCFTSVQRLTTWADDVEPDPRGGGPLEEFRFGGSGRQWQRAGDARVGPHEGVPAAGLATRVGAHPRRRARPPALPGVRQLPGQARPAGRGRHRPRPPPDRAAGPARPGPGPAAAAALRALRLPRVAFGPRPGRGPGDRGRPRRPGRRGRPAGRRRRAHPGRRAGAAARPLPRRRHLCRRAWRWGA